MYSSYLGEGEKDEKPQDCAKLLNNNYIRSVH